MKITAVTNTYKHSTSYHVGEEGQTLVTLRSLEEAALVFRYLTGAEMPEADAARALAIMAAADAQTAAKNAKKGGAKHG